MDTRETASLPLRELWREDFQRHDRRWSQPGLHAVLVYRLGAWIRYRRERAGSAGRLALFPLHLLQRMLFVFVRNVYGIELHPETRVGRRLRLTHQHGISIHYAATIGDDCMIAYGVTIGVGTEATRSRSATVGNRVEISPGAVILGPVRIGDGARIGPNALVISDVPAGATVFATPSRILTLPRGTGNQ